MFEDGSRYGALETAEHLTADGRRVRYVRRRFLPQGASLRSLGDAVVVAGDRLDLLAARTLGDPERYWRICDANDAMHPVDLLAEPGRVLRIPVADAGGF
jgi:nucleoid-associated protein YgaU